jgi:hypothetical protein
LGEDRVEKRSPIVDDCPGYSAAYFWRKLLTELLYLGEVHYGMDFIEVYEVVTPISKEYPEESHVCCNVLLEVPIIACRLARNCSLHILDVVIKLASLFRCIQSQFPFFNLLGFIVGPGAAAKERESFSSRLNIRNTFTGVEA